MNGVWITGIGVVSAAGIGPESLWRAIASGTPCIRSLAPDLWGGHVADSLRRQLPHGAGSALGRSGKLLVAAALDAWRDAGLEDAGDVACEAGLLGASSIGPLAEALDAQARALSGRKPLPGDVSRCAPGSAAAFAAAAIGALGPLLSISGGSVSSMLAIGEAWIKVATGQLDVCVAAAGEAPLHPRIVDIFRAAGIVADGGPDACRPFDRMRTGTLLGEAGAALVLESAAHARRRGRRPHGVIRGYASAGDPEARRTAPDPEARGLTRAVVRALTIAGIARSDVDYLQLHGTGTRLGDAAEARALAAIFGADRAARIPAAATKPITGHCLGASGAVETIVALLAMRDQCVPPTANVSVIDCEVGIAAAARNATINTAVVESAGFGGRTAALVLARGA